MSKVLITEEYLLDIADAIREKLETQNEYKPSEMAEAILSISGGGGDTKDFILKYYTYDASGSYEATEDGVYLIVSATSHQSSRTITIPQTATIIDERSVNLGSGRGIEVHIVSLSVGDTVSITQTWGSWDRRAFFIVKLENITVESNVSLTATSDGSATGTTTSGTKSLVLGVGLGSSKRNDSSLNYSALFLSGAWGHGVIVALYLTDHAETFSFYGYDGGLGSVGIWEIS